MQSFVLGVESILARLFRGSGGIVVCHGRGVAHGKFQRVSGCGQRWVNPSSQTDGHRPGFVGTRFPLPPQDLRLQRHSFAWSGPWRAERITSCPVWWHRPMVYQDRPRFPYEPSFSLEGPFSPIGFVLTPPSDGPSLPVAPPHVHEDAPVNYVRVHGGNGRMSRWPMVSCFAREANDGAYFSILVRVFRECCGESPLPIHGFAHPSVACYTP